MYRCVQLKCHLCVKGSVRLVSVSCGSQNVWAVDSRGVVYFRVGTQPLNPSMMLPAWIHIEPPVQVTHTHTHRNHIDLPVHSVCVTRLGNCGIVSL